MKLCSLLTGVADDLSDYDESVEISSIAYDSRKVEEGSLFAALAGVNTDGNKYISQALANGAAYILSGSKMDDIAGGQLICDNPRSVLRKISENFYGTPETKLCMIAITGTNGKTTIAHIIAHILRTLGKCCGVLGTVAYDLVSEVIPAPLTTPESPDFQKYLKMMLDNNAEYAVCEYSSQALAQERVAGDNVDYAVFTNLSRDHLDNHGSMENYLLAKKRLFDKLSKNSFAIINSSDKYAERIVQDTAAKVVRIGHSAADDFRIISAEFNVKETRLVIEVAGKEYSINSALIGEYNAINLLEAVAVVYSSGFSLDKIIAAAAGFSGASGRLERLEASDGRVAFVDYAHTDDALMSALQVLRKITPGRLILVFGCGGVRDRGKRALMARVAEKLADVVIITNDNPRTEAPEQIMADILEGIENKDEVVIEYDRAQAIAHALSVAGAEDVVLVAGKGHEDYQIIGKNKIHFCDREIINKIFQNT